MPRRVSPCFRCAVPDWRNQAFALKFRFLSIGSTVFALSRGRGTQPCARSIDDVSRASQDFGEWLFLLTFWTFAFARSSCHTHRTVSLSALPDFVNRNTHSLLVHV